MRIVILVVLTLITAFGCKKGGSKPGTQELPPSKAVLISPAKNAVCIEGTSVSASQSAVLLSWNAASNTDTYEIVVKNLFTNAESKSTSSQPSVSVTLLKNTPYSWYVISKSAKASSTAQSEVWKFYNSGEGAISYAPFPAEIVSPVFDQNINAVNSKVTLDWTGSDADNDIVSYAVYLGTTSSPALLNGNVTVTELSNVTVTANTPYFWKVITKDSAGNTSDSGVYRFNVN
ncbi:MAG: hypothetical protein H7Y13_17475 [Sphingobacteriaceae bacterium]|nr:hypothetical protein [Sphingobacteriaceae bacterium]